MKHRAMAGLVVLLSVVFLSTHGGAASATRDEFHASRPSAVGPKCSSSAIAITAAFLFAMLVSSVLGALLERIAYRPLRKAPRLAPLISAIGASIFLQNVMMLIIKARMQVYPDVIPEQFIDVGTISISYFQIFIILGSVLLMVGLYLFIQRTKIGKAMRAVAENKEAAALMGIDVNRIILITFIIGSTLAAAAGVMVGMYYTQINHMMGFIPGIKAITSLYSAGMNRTPRASAMPRKYPPSMAPTGFPIPPRTAAVKALIPGIKPIM